MTFSVESASQASPNVFKALQHAAVRSGVDFDYLLTTARRESSLNPLAESKSSSAQGLFQFVKQTWLATLKKYGADHGYGAYADAISQGTDGRYHVSDSARAAEIFALRTDPQASCAMAAELTKETSQILEGELGRAPTKGELYAAHVLGASGASKLITLAETAPDTLAASCFPEAAACNQGLFRTKDGEAVTVSGLLDRLGRGLSSDGTSTPAPFTANRAAAAPAATAESARVWRSVAAQTPQMWTAPPRTSAAVVHAPTPVTIGRRYGFSGLPLTLTPQLLTLLATITPTKTGTHHDG